MTKEWIQEKEAEYNKILQETGEEILAFLKECPYYSKEEREAYIEKVESAMNGYSREELVPCLDMSLRFSSLIWAEDGISQDMSADSMETLKKWIKKKNELKLSELHKAASGKAYVGRLENHEPMEFSGDIVITDPCYLIRKGKKSDGTDQPKPREEDFLSYPEITDYPDCKELVPGIGIYNSEQYMDEREKYEKALTAHQALTDDWMKCEYGDRMDLLGIHKCMVRGTIYGDWSCSVFRKDEYGYEEEIGNFCADAGLVIVADMAEVLAYNPDFEEWAKEHTWCATILKGFEGTVQFVVEEAEPDEEEDEEGGCLCTTFDSYEVKVVGRGTYLDKDGNRKKCNFVGRQTGL